MADAGIEDAERSGLEQVLRQFLRSTVITGIEAGGEVGRPAEIVEAAGEIGEVIVIGDGNRFPL